MPVYAMATPSNATPLDADRPHKVSSMVFNVAENQIAPASSLVTITNTVNYAGVTVTLRYYDMSNVLRRASVLVSSDGSFTITRPSDYVKPSMLTVQFNKPALPPAGKYTFTADFSSHVGGIGYGSSNIRANRFINNSEDENLSGPVTFQSSSGDYVLSTSLDMGGSVDYIYYNIGLSSFAFPYGGYLKFNFTKLPSDSNVDFSTPGTSDADKSASNSSNISNINSTLSGMASNLSSASDSLLQVVRNFYNKFIDFGTLFTNTYEVLFSHMTTQTNRLISAIENIHVEFGEFATEIIQNDNQLHEEQLANDNQIAQEQLANDNKNHEELVNGYDPSNLDSSNNKLSASLDQYEAKEQELIGSVQGHIDNFTYTDPFSQFSAPLADVSYFLTGIYNGLGSLNIPIAFSLTLSIGLICIGWYRFKGG